MNCVIFLHTVLLFRLTNTDDDINKRVNVYVEFERRHLYELKIYNGTVYMKRTKILFNLIEVPYTTV